MMLTITGNEPAPVVVEKEVSQKTKTLAIPKAVGEMNTKACQNHFQTLTKQQQKDVLKVFYAMLKTGTIRSKANYFIGLTRLAKKDGLTLPDASVGTSTAGGGFNNTHAYTKVLTPEEMTKQ